MRKAWWYAALIALTAQSVWAQNYPARPLRLIVP